MLFSKTEGGTKRKWRANGILLKVEELKICMSELRGFVCGKIARLCLSGGWRQGVGWVGV